MNVGIIGNTQYGQLHFFGWYTVLNSKEGCCEQREQHMMQRTHFKSEHDYYGYDNRWRLATQHTHTHTTEDKTAYMILEIHASEVIWRQICGKFRITSKLYPPFLIMAHCLAFGLNNCIYCLGRAQKISRRIHLLHKTMVRH